jgi:nitrogen regulatory protein PII-like uncharacterized protein
MVFIEIKKMLRFFDRISDTGITGCFLYINNQ